MPTPILIAHLILGAAIVSLAWLLFGTRTGRAGLRWFLEDKWLVLHGLLTGIAVALAMWAAAVIGCWWGSR